MDARGGSRLDDARRALWHLRRGGLSQFRTYLRRRGVPRPAGSSGAIRSDHGVTFEPWTVSQRATARPTLRVGVILDDFSRLAFGFEWDQVALTPMS